MLPEHLNFGGGVSHTTLNPVVLLAILVVGLLILVLPRNKVIVLFLAASILIPVDQVLLVGPFHFPTLRILILFGLIRILCAKLSANGHIFSRGMNGIDKAVIALTLLTAVNGILLWQQSGEVIFQLGNLYSIFGVYFLVRFLIRDQEDVMRTLRALACITAVVAVVMIGEQATGHNLLYTALGGARASMYGSVMERDTHLRATGCFAHPILAGTFGGFMLPLFLGLWWKERKDRKYAALGAVSATVLPFAASSSTALFVFFGGLLGLGFWPLRRHMRVFRWAIVFTLVSLHMVMKAPVWHLISRIDLTGSSSSYHRFQLVNQCILHFSDWWLIGTKSYADWGLDMWDLSNQFVGIADTAGLIPLISFLAIFVFGFKYLGRARQRSEGDRKQGLFIWSIGASLFANVVAYMGIDYFDQIIVPWYSLLAMISTVTVQPRSTEPLGQPEVTSRVDLPLSRQLALGSVAQRSE